MSQDEEIKGDGEKYASVTGTKETVLALQEELKAFSSKPENFTQTFDIPIQDESTFNLIIDDVEKEFGVKVEILKKRNAF